VWSIGSAASNCRVFAEAGALNRLAGMKTSNHLCVTSLLGNFFEADWAMRTESSMKPRAWPSPRWKNTCANMADTACDVSEDARRCPEWTEKAGSRWVITCRRATQERVPVEVVFNYFLGSIEPKPGLESQKKEAVHCLFLSELINQLTYPVNASTVASPFSKDSPRDSLSRRTSSVRFL